MDQNLPREVAALLTAAGHGAVTVLDQDMGGVADPELFAACQAEGRVLVTLDRGLGDIRVYPPAAPSGVVVLRVARQDRETVLGAVRRLLPVLERESPAGKLWVAEPSRIRIRG